MPRLFQLLIFPSLMAISLVGCSSQTPPEAASTDGELPAAATPDSDDTSSAPANQDENASAIVIDVRSQDEWDSGHVEQAHHIPHAEITERISEVTQDKDAQIVLYCAAGGRAGRAKTALEELGFTNVENAGGYDDVKERFE